MNATRSLTLVSNIRALTLALGLSAILVAPAFAQRPGDRGGPRPFGGGMGMRGTPSPIQALMAPPVHAELGLSEKQIESLGPIAEEFRNQMRSRMQEMRGQLSDLSPEERRTRLEAASQELTASIRDQLQKILTDEQLSRLDQIQRQQRGVLAFEEPEIQERLKLSEEQQSQIGQIIETYRTEIRELMAETRQAQQPNRPMEQVLRLRRGSMDKALEVLSDEQRSTWSEVVGKPFEMRMFGPRGRRGPGDGRRSGQN